MSEQGEFEIEMETRRVGESTYTLVVGPGFEILAMNASEEDCVKAAREAYLANIALEKQRAGRAE